MKQICKAAIYAVIICLSIPPNGFAQDYQRNGVYPRAPLRGLVRGKLMRFSILQTVHNLQ